MRLARLVLPVRHLLPPLLLVGFVGVLVARACGVPAAPLPTPTPTSTPTSVPTSVPSARGPIGASPAVVSGADEAAVIALFERASPSVVHVTNLVMVQRSRTEVPTEVPQGSGTGFVWDVEGHIVTNFHVVEGGNDFVVTLTDRTQRHATLVGTAPSYDLAVLEMEDVADLPRPLVALPLGDSSNLRVGQTVFAIGNPFGLDQTLTHGILSGLGREVQSPTGRPIYDVIQTDASINPGNSGGPLLDSSGRVIGVNSQIASPSGGSAGIGFAIPVGTVTRVVPELIRSGGFYRRPVLGVQVALDGDPRAVQADGALVDQVVRQSGAASAGIAPNDVIVRVGTQAVRGRIDLYRAIDARRVGEKVPVTFLRDGKETTVDVELAGTER
ncbi:MAG: trypsin-like peptidase domain-containing protein [Planctomycetes bacterium]|nr:trypsin-like peptidase domain-containing protein [Planctomycetota bacterium]